MALKMGFIITICIYIFNSAAGEVPSSHDYPDFKISEPVLVRPLFFFPSDSSRSESSVAESTALLKKHLELAREQYRRLLKKTSFAIAAGDPKIFRSSQANSWFAALQKKDEGHAAHRILKELLDWRKETRNSTRSLFLVIYVRPLGNEKITHNMFGGGRIINGPPGSGGGYIELEYTALNSDNPYPFQSTLIHELGHSLGLTHSTVFGDDLQTGRSVMSYNPIHQSKGLSLSATPGIFLPEEILVLCGNTPTLPGLIYDKTLHGVPANDRTVWNRPQLGAMNDSIGPLKGFDGVGYELYFNGKKVSGADATYYTRLEAEQNLAWNLNHQKEIVVTGRYNGVVLLK